tara:strand:- start:726 stop:1427 length:702 start_codon:yes stop_codon:yes gene_type:complete
MITSNTKITNKDIHFNKWVQLAELMLKEGIVEDIIKFAEQLLPKLNASFGEDNTIQTLTLEEWEQLYFRWQNLQIASNPQVEKLNRGQFYIGFELDSSESGIFYVNPLSREEWETPEDNIGLIYFGAKPMAVLCEDEVTHGKDFQGEVIIFRDNLLKNFNIGDTELTKKFSEDLGYNNCLSDVSILNEPDENGSPPWTMKYNQSWFEGEGWEFYPVSFEVKPPSQLGVFNWWW